MSDDVSTLADFFTSAQADLHCSRFRETPKTAKASTAGGGHTVHQGWVGNGLVSSSIEGRNLLRCHGTTATQRDREQVGSHSFPPALTPRRINPSDWVLFACAPPPSITPPAGQQQERGIATPVSRCWTATANEVNYTPALTPPPLGWGPHAGEGMHARLKQTHIEGGYENKVVISTRPWSLRSFSSLN